MGVCIGETPNSSTAEDCSTLQSTDQPSLLHYTFSLQYLSVTINSLQYQFSSIYQGSFDIRLFQNGSSQNLDWNNLLTIQISQMMIHLFSHLFSLNFFFFVFADTCLKDPCKFNFRLWWCWWLLFWNL